jgi:hypothetical protein
MASAAQQTTPCAIWLLEQLPCLLSNPTSSGRAPASAISRWCSGCSRPICRMSMHCKPDVLALLSCSWHKFWWCLRSFTRKEQLVVISIKISYFQSHNHNPTEKCLLHRGDTSHSFFLKILNCVGIIGRPLYDNPIQLKFMKYMISYKSEEKEMDTQFGSEQTPHKWKYIESLSIPFEQIIECWKLYSIKIACTVWRDISGEWTNEIHPTMWSQKVKINYSIIFSSSCHAKITQFFFGKPDPIYHNQLVNMLVNRILRHWKKSLAYQINEKY